MFEKRLSLFAAVVVVLATVGGGVALATTDSPSEQAPETTQPSNTSTIQVSASGSVASSPDKAVIRLGVEATAENASVARKRVAENVSAMRNALETLGLGADQIRTTDYDLFKEERRGAHRDEKGTEKAVYRARHQFAVELYDADRAGSVIDTAIASGATNLYDIDFTLSAETRRSLREQALERAMTNARSEADTLARSANLTVSGVDIVTTVDGGGGGIPQGTAVATGADGTGSTSISSGPVTVSVSVTVEYEAIPSE